MKRHKHVFTLVSFILKKGTPHISLPLLLKDGQCFMGSINERTIQQEKKSKTGVFNVHRRYKLSSFCTLCFTVALC